MENDIAMYAASFLFARLAVLAGFAYLFYMVLRRPAEARVSIDYRSRASGRAERLPDNGY